jgi:hypothetical protein
MTMLSARLARAMETGRAPRPAATRPQLLAGLLRKRAAAHAAGATELEKLLRDQIRWSLPIIRG